MWFRWVLVVAITVVGCDREVARPQPGRADPVPRDAMQPPDAMQPTLTWRAHTIAGAGLTIDVVDGPEVRDSTLPTMRVVAQFSPQISLVVWLGADRTLATWRDVVATRERTGPEVAIEVCGRPAHRQEVTVPESHATGMFTKPKGGWEERTSDTPATIHVAIAGTTATNTPFVASWKVDADKRDGLRADEAHFLASIRCP